MLLSKATCTAFKVHMLSVHAIPGHRNHDLGVSSTCSALRASGSHYEDLIIHLIISAFWKNKQILEESNLEHLNPNEKEEVLKRSVFGWRRLLCFFPQGLHWFQHTKHTKHKITIKSIWAAGHLPLLSYLHLKGHVENSFNFKSSV